MPANFDNIIKAFSIRRAVEILTEPQLHRQELPVLIGILIALAFVVILLVAVVFVRPSKKAPEEHAKHKPVSLRLLIGFAVLVAFLLVAGSLMLNSLTSKPTFCASCHGQEVKAWRSSIHDFVSCARCHTPVGMVGAITSRLNLAQMLVSRVFAKPQKVSDRIDMAVCLGCHAKIKTSKTVTHRIRMSHAEPLAAGYDCNDCHLKSNLAHGLRKRLRPNEMAVCNDCHEGSKASTSCNTCHSLEGIGERLSIKDYPKISLQPPENCRGCHSTASCRICHAIELPHSSKWNESEHGLAGFTNLKICEQCHDAKQFCGRCHTVSPKPHPVDWQTEHAVLATDSEATCNNCHKEQEFCLLCHKNVQDFRLKEVTEGFGLPDTATPSIRNGHPGSSRP